MLFTSGAKTVRGKMQRVLLTSYLTNNLTVAKIVFESITLFNTFLTFLFRSLKILKICLVYRE